MVLCAQAAKKKGKSKSKKAAIVDPLKCGVCVAVAEVVLGEVRKKENDTTTLDLRWGLTAEVKEGKAKRLGKVIPYKRSEVLAVEVMESACDQMKDFGVYKGVAGESQLVLMSVLGGMKEEAQGWWWSSCPSHVLPVLLSTTTITPRPPSQWHRLRASVPLEFAGAGACAFDLPNEIFKGGKLASSSSSRLSFRSIWSNCDELVDAR